MIGSIALEDTDSPLPLGVPLRLGVAIASGIAMRFVLALHPTAWLAWVAPAPLLLLALKSDERQARWLLLLAMGLGCSVNVSYYQLVMGTGLAVLVTTAMTFLWRFVLLASRRLTLRFATGWTIFIYPVLWVAVDQLMAALLPDGNWASLAYSQADNPRIAQVASLFGVSGILFLVALVPSSIAFALTYGRRTPRAAPAFMLTALLLGTAVLFGEFRLREPRRGDEVVFGLASIDDAIGVQAQPQYIASILAQYERQIADLAAQGAHVVVLPEKIAVQPAAQIAGLRTRFSELAARHHVWLEVGVAQDDGTPIRNLSWLFEPSGALAATYQKHHLAPPERSYARGEDFVTRAIDGREFGLAICKDMHFASFGRAYADRAAAVMLVPAWDFYFDAWMGARMTAMRGIENGYTVVRSSREGFLTVSDPYGRIIAETKSAALPGATLLATARIGPPVWTLYSRTGDVLGWTCVVAAMWMFVQLRRAATRAAPTGSK